MGLKRKSNFLTPFSFPPVYKGHAQCVAAFLFGMYFYNKGEGKQDGFPLSRE
jgi:hypothetical protein